MKKIILSLVVLTVVAAGIAIIWYERHPKEASPTQPSTDHTRPSQVSQSERTSISDSVPNKDIPRREDRVFRGMKISDLTEWNRRMLYDEKTDANSKSTILLNLGLYGTDEAVKILKEYLKENETLLPYPVPTKEELGDEKQIKKRMSVTDPIAPEGRILCTIENLIGSGSTGGKSSADEFIARMKNKYSNTDYGIVFLEHLENAIRRGNAANKDNEQIRKKYNL